MGTICLFLIKITILIIGIVSLTRPISVISTIYENSKIMIDKFGMYDFVDSKTKEATKLVLENPEKFKKEYPVHVAIVRVTGIIFIVIFIISLCGMNPLR